MLRRSPTDGSAPRRRLSLRKRVVFALLTAGLVLATTELGCAVLLLATGGEWSYAALRSAQADVASSRTAPNVVEDEVVHPFLGYVLDPDHVANVNDLGFRRADADVPRRAPDRIVIGVTGGSVAMEFCRLGGGALKRELSRRFPDRSVSLTCLALQGYRQPQQLMAVNYLCCLGAEFDVIVCLDGFNEVALPPAEDPRGEVFELYPRRWAERLPDIMDERELELRLAGSRLRAQRRALALDWSRAPWRYSALSLVVWRWRDERLRTELVRLATELSEHKLPEIGRQYALRGPHRDALPPPARAVRLADDWAACSRQLHRVCDGIGAVYVHALQPNQYVAESKPLSAQEVEFAVRPDSEYVPAVANGYPELREQGRRLRDEGENFLDLTEIFAGVSETIYVDDCCHMNERGNSILAERLAEEITAALEHAPPGASRRNVAE